MPSALATIISRLRTTLDDATSTIWSDAELTAHIQRALRDLSHFIPREQKTTKATTNGSRDMDISTLTERVRIVAVEFPVGNFPKTFTRFSLWLDTLTMLDAEGNGANCYIYWHAVHAINGTKTLPEDHDETLLFVSAALACDQQAAGVTDTLATGGPGTERDWSSLAAHFRARYNERINPRRGVRVTRMYTPVEPTATQDSDPGP